MPSSLQDQELSCLGIYVCIILQSKDGNRYPKPDGFGLIKPNGFVPVAIITSIPSSYTPVVSSSIAWGPDPCHQTPPFHRPDSNQRCTPNNHHMHHRLSSLSLYSVISIYSTTIYIDDQLDFVKATRYLIRVARQVHFQLVCSNIPNLKCIMHQQSNRYSHGLSIQNSNLQASASGDTATPIHWILGTEAYEHRKTNLYSCFFG